MGASEKGMGHRECCRRHVIKRAWERLALRLGQCDVLAIETFVGSGGGTVIRQTGRDGWVVGLTYRDVEFALVYDKNLSCAVTVMPPDYAGVQAGGLKEPETAR